MMIEVVEEINRSDMPKATKANALALLSLAHPDNGHVSITWDELARAFGHISLSRMRVHMAHMQACDLIHYSSNGNGMVYINFKAWIRNENDDPTREKRRSHARKTTIPRAKNDDPTRAEETEENGNDDPTREKRRSHARKTTIPRAKNDDDLYASAPAVGWLVGNDPSNPDREPTNQPDPPRPTLQPWEAPLSFRLLSDKRVAMAPKNAQRLAPACPYWQIRDAVAHWYCGRKCAGGKFDDTPGIVVAWLDEPEKFVIPTLSEEFRHSELYRDYRTPDELAAEQAALDEAQRWAEEPEEEPPEDPPELQYEPDEGTPAWAWQQVQRELAIEQGGTFDRWVDGARLVDHDPDTNTFTIALPDAFRYDWIVNRLSRQINRKLAAITRQPSAQTKFIIDTPGTVSRETQGDST